MAGMGPAPKAAGQRRRRNVTVATTRLPVEGRGGEPPAWPLRGEPSEAAAAVWAELWSTPQAAAWERMGAGTVRIVARYLLMLGEAEYGDVKACAEVRQLEDRLGLSPMSMLRLRWEIAPDEVAEARAARAAPQTTDVRRRLRIADTAASGQ